MRAKLIRSEQEEGGLIVIEINGRQIAGMDKVVYSALPYPQQGEEFSVTFDCLFEDDAVDDVMTLDTHTQWQALFNGNPQQEQALVSRGLWSYRALGKLVCIDNNEDIALADCGGCLLPIPQEVRATECLGQFLGFDILRLDIGRA